MSQYYFNSREFDRGNVEISAHIRVAGSGRNAMKVIDLSQSGFRAECLLHIPDDKLTFLKLLGFSQLECRVVWRTEWIYGFEFVGRLHPAIYDDIILKHPEFAQPTLHLLTGTAAAF